MCRMKEKGMDEQQKSEAWDRLDTLLIKHELQDKFNDWGTMYGMAHALHNVKDTLINLGEKDISKFIDGVIWEVIRAQESCGGGHATCGCESHEEVAGGVSSNEVVTPAEAEAVGEAVEVVEDVGVAGGGVAKVVPPSKDGFTSVGENEYRPMFKE